MPWTGKNWGMIAIPRIGQEVVIQFEEGDPDRPICTGMLYNVDTMPPWELPEHKTQTGIKTNSSKDGGGYNEVMFEDKKGGEMLRVQAQMNHQMLVKNKSVVTIGQGEIDAGDHDEEGSLSQTVRNHVTETIQEGDHYFTIETGSQIADINTDQSLSIGNDQIHTIANDQTTTIGNNQDILVSASKTQTIDTGDYSTTVNVGNILVKAGSGKIKIEAAQKIELMVGASSITIDPAQVAIKAPIVKIEGTALTQIKSPLTDIKGDAAVVVKGTFTMIN
jgi:type VI secretion system secreted protein VgrG